MKRSSKRSDRELLTLGGAHAQISVAISELMAIRGATTDHTLLNLALLGVIRRLNTAGARILEVEPTANLPDPTKPKSEDNYPNEY